MLFAPCSVYQTSDIKEREYQPSYSSYGFPQGPTTYPKVLASLLRLSQILLLQQVDQNTDLRDRENNGSANHVSVVDENLITPAKGRVEEGISGSQKLSSSLQVQQQNKTFKQTNYILDILCASRKIRDSFHSQTYYR